MIRERAHVVTRDRAAWHRVVETVEECNRLSEERGWPPSVVWSFVAGRTAELVVETDHPDLAAFQRVHEERHADGGWQILTKPLADALVDEGSYTELLSTTGSDD